MPFFLHEKIEMRFSSPIPPKLKCLFLDWKKAHTQPTKSNDYLAQSIMTDAAIIALTNKLNARKKETKDFLKMIEQSDVSSKVAATKDETPEEDTITVYRVVGEFIITNDDGEQIGTREEDIGDFDLLEDAQFEFEECRNSLTCPAFDVIRLESFTQRGDDKYDYETIEAWVRPDEEEKKEKQSKTQNRKDNRVVVRAEYSGPEFWFKIPDGLDLEDKTVVKWWGVFYDELSIHYVDGREEQICAFEEFEGEAKRPHEVEIELVEDCGAFENPYEEEDEEE